MSVLFHFSIFPTGKGESVSKYVARAVDVIRRSGLPHNLEPMGTTIEAEWDEGLAVITRCYEELSEVADRVGGTIKFDARKDRTGRLEGKVRAILDKLDD